MADISKTLYSVSRGEEERHTQELAKKFDLPYINLASYPLTRESLSVIPEELAIQYRVIPYLKLGKSVKVGVVRPTDPELIEFLRRHAAAVGVEFILSVMSQTSFLYGLSFYEQVKKEDAIKNQPSAQAGGTSIGEAIVDLKSIAEVIKQVSTTQMLDVIVLGAVRNKASDIHVEPYEKETLVRYRIDGVLQEVVKLSPNQHHQLLSRVKFLSGLHMDVANKPQDGRFSIKDDQGKSLDLRVSIMPSSFGETIVARVLGQETSILRLEKLGIRSETLAAIREAISKPNGMILTSGPTGSGKSSTLYAVLMEMKSPGVKIITLEDPIEYRIDGIEQSQVKPDEGYTFADGLRACMRQDPDILMVGEIRDGETAEIAVQAALTGHLLISTIHANSAPAVFARLLEMGVKPFLLSGSVNLVMAQRLIRKVCANCRELYTPHPDIWAEIKRIMEPVRKHLDPNMQKFLDAPMIQLVKGKGCDQCNHTGYSGRAMIIEALVPNEEIEALISENTTISAFEKAAKAQGMVTLEQDGIIRVLQGTTTIEEIWRVTKD